MISLLLSFHVSWLWTASVVIWGVRRPLER